jgi:hypothetical protein
MSYALFREIAHRHNITVDDGLEDREHLSERGLNLAANVPVGMFYGFIAIIAMRRVHQRLSYEDEPLAVVVATVLTSLIVARLGGRVRAIVKAPSKCFESAIAI